jgi:hypothetical protein
MCLNELLVTGLIVMLWALCVFCTEAYTENYFYAETFYNHFSIIESL